VAFLKLDSYWFEPNDVLVLNIQLSYQTFPIPPAIADSIPLHEALRTRLSWPLFWLNWLKWLESLGLATWRFSPFFARSGHPPNQAIVDNFSELETQSLIVRCLDPSHGFDSHEDVGDFVVDICCCLSWNWKTYSYAYFDKSSIMNLLQYLRPNWIHFPWKHCRLMNQMICCYLCLRVFCWHQGGLQLPPWSHC